MRQVLVHFAIALALFDAALSWAGPADDQFAVASAHYRRARWQLAVTEFSEFIRRYPQDPRAGEATFFLAEANTQSGQYQQALDDYRQFLSAAGDSPYVAQARFRVGESLLMLDRAAEARTELAAFSRQHPAHALNAYAQVYLGQIALRLGDSEQAVKKLQAALQRYPQGPLADDCRLALAQAEQGVGRSDQAGAGYQALAASSKHADIAQFNLAVLRYSQGDYEPAAQAFAECLERFPESDLATRARIGQAWSRYQLQDWNSAVGLFEQVAKAEAPESYEAGYGLAMVALAKHDFKDAESRLKQLLEQQPDHPLAETIAYHAADACLRQEKYERAVATFERVRSRWPAGTWHDQAVLGKLLACESLSRLDAAAEVAESFLAQPGSSDLADDVLGAYGRVLVKQQRFAAAVEVLEPLLARKTDPQLAYSLALARCATGQYDEAAEQLQRLLTVDVGVARSEILTALAALEMDRRRFRQAAAYLEQYLAEDVTEAERNAAWQQRVQCLLSAHDPDAASRAWDDLTVDELPKETTAPLARSLAEAQFAAGEYAAAEKRFAWLAEQGDKDQRDHGLSGQAWCQFKLDEFEQCIATCDRLLAAGSERTAEALLLKADALARIGRDATALASLQELIEQHPTTQQAPRARWLAARLHAQLGQHDAAFALYSQLIEQRPVMFESQPELPATDELLYQAAWTRFDAREPEAAVKLLKRIHGQHPNSSRWGDATYRLAEHAYRNGKLEQANALLSGILAGDNRANLTEVRHRSLELSALVAAASRDWKQVDQRMEQLLAAQPKPELVARAKYWRAEAAWQQQSFDLAEQRFEELLENPLEAGVQAKARLRLAQLYFQNKRYLQALETAEAVLKEDASDVPADELHLVIGRSLAMRADFDAARAAYHRAIGASGDRRTETAAMAQWLVGETYFHQKQYEAALREYLRVEILYAWPAWQSTALLQAGKCYEHLNQWQQAAETYRRLLENWPQATVASDAAARLKVVQQKLNTPPRTARGKSPARTP